MGLLSILDHGASSHAPHYLSGVRSMSRNPFKTCGEESCVTAASSTVWGGEVYGEHEAGVVG